MAEGTDEVGAPCQDLLSAQSPETLAALRELRERLGAPSPHVTDFFLLRFLLAKKCVVEDAAESVSQRLEWEGDCNLEQLLAAGPLDETTQIKRFYPHGYHGVDRHFRPVNIERVGLLDIRALLACTSRERLTRRFIREFELLVRRKFPACSLLAGRLVHRVLNVIDLDGLSFHAASDAQAKALVLQLLKLQQRCYPEVTGKTLIINAPRVFSIVWQVIKPHLSPKALERIEIIGQDPQRVKRRLLQLVEPHQLPDFLGGECCCSSGCLCSDRGPWQSEEATRCLERLPYYDVIQQFAEGRTAELPASTPVALEESEPQEPPAAVEARVRPARKRWCARFCSLLSSKRKTLAEEEKEEEPLPESPIPPQVLQVEVEQLCHRLSSLEREHMKTLESWIEKSLPWEAELVLAPLHQAEEQLRRAQQRLEEAETAYREASSQHEDLTQAVCAAKLRLEVLVQADNHPELPEHAYTNACTALKELVDRVAEAELQREAAKFQHEGADAEFEEKKAQHGRFFPYFVAKREHEKELLEQVNLMNAVRSNLVEAAERAGLKVPDTRLSLEDFEMPGLQGSIPNYSLPSAPEREASWICPDGEHPPEDGFVSTAQGVVE